MSFCTTVWDSSVITSNKNKPSGQSFPLTEPDGQYLPWGHNPPVIPWFGVLLEAFNVQ